MTATILVKAAPECNNYTILYDTSRKVNRNISRPSSSCDRDLVGNGTWYWFNEPKILQHLCPNKTSHYCGVDHQGYFTQPHSSAEHGVKEIQIYYYRFYCSGDYRTALVKNCASFIVYKFTILELQLWYLHRICNTQLTDTIICQHKRFRWVLWTV